MPSAHLRDTRPNQLASRLLRINWPLLALVGLIGSIGVAMLYSVAGGSFTPWAEQHVIRLMAGLALVIVMAVLPIRLWAVLAIPVYLAGLVLLGLVPYLGADAMGAKRWIRLGPLGIQPSEFMKPALVLVLARYYQWLPPARVSRPFWVLLPFLAIALPVGLVLKQPDLGTAVLFACVGLGLMFLAGVNLLYFAGGAAGIVALAPLLWSHLHDYQRRRLLVFLDPDRDPLGAGYHITQSKIALGSGGLVGKGYMLGTQGRLEFLPEKQTDFIFTMLAEEMGFVGGVTLIGLYAALVVGLLVLAMRCRSQMTRLLLAGPAIAIFVHAAVNISMVMGLVPVVGVPLPFVSFGGSATLSLLTGLGLAMSGWVDRHERLRRDGL